MWRHFAGRDFPLEGFWERLFPAEGFELGEISPHSQLISITKFKTKVDNIIFTNFRVFFFTLANQGRGTHYVRYITTCRPHTVC